MDIARVLRKVESRRTGIGEDRNSLEEWKSALKRGEADIQAIETFSKEDKHKVEVRKATLYSSPSRLEVLGLRNP